MTSNTSTTPTMTPYAGAHISLPALDTTKVPGRSEFFALPTRQFAIDQDTRTLVYFESTSRLRAVPHTITDRGDDSSSNSISSRGTGYTITCDPPLDSMPTYLKFVTARTLVCASATAVHVCELPHVFTRTQAQTAGLIARTYSIARHTVSSRGVTVLSVDAHPVSPAHIAILTSDSVLRVYNTDRDIEDPEQIFDIRHGTSFRRHHQHQDDNNNGDEDCDDEDVDEDGTHERVPRAISFAFSPVTSPLWDRFTVYILLDDGSVGALCPVVPYRAVVPASHIDELVAVTSQHIGVARQYRDQAAREAAETRGQSAATRSGVGESKAEVKLRDAEDRLSQYQLQMRYLSEITGPVVEDTGTRLTGHGDAVVADSDSDDYRVREGRLGSGANTRGTAANGPTSITSSSTGEGNGSGGSGEVTAAGTTLLHLRYPGVKSASWLPSLQIVHRPSVQLARGVHAIRIVALPSFPPAVLAGHSDGVLSVLISVDPRSAHWSPAVAPTSYGLHWIAQEDSQLSLLEEHDLCLPPAAQQPGAAQALDIQIDPRRRQRVLIACAGGAYSLDMPILMQLETLTSALDPDDPVPDREPSGFPPSDLARVIDTMPVPSSPANPLRGSQILFDAWSRPHVIAIDASSRLFALRLIGRRAPTDSLFTSTGGRVPFHVPPFAHIIDPILEKGKQAVTTTSLHAETVNSQNPEVLAWFLEQVKKLRDSHVLHAHTINEHVSQRANILSKLAEQQRKNLNGIGVELADREAFRDYLSAKLDHAKESQEVLIERAQLLLQSVHDLESTVSLEETAYRDSLKTMHDTTLPQLKKRLQEAKTRLAQLSTPQGKGAVADSRGNGNGGGIPARDLERIRHVLEEEKTMIDATIASVRQLSIDVEGTSNLKAR